MSAVALGTGGVGAVVVKCALAMSGFDLIGIREHSNDLHGNQALGPTEFGLINALSSFAFWLTGNLVSVGKNSDRVSLINAVRKHGIDWPYSSAPGQVAFQAC
jgi:hypothetical protein